MLFDLRMNIEPKKWSSQKDYNLSNRSNGLISFKIWKHFCCMRQDMGHLPETKIQKFLHEPANVGRSVQSGQDDTTDTTPTTEAMAAPPQREGTSRYG